MDFRNVDTHQTKQGGPGRPDHGSKVSVWYEECTQHAIKWSKTHYDLSMDFRNVDTHQTKQEGPGRP